MSLPNTSRFELTATPLMKDRMEKVLVDVGLQIAKEYGDDLPEICLPWLLDAAVADDDATAFAATGNRDYLPADMRAFAVRLVEANELAVRGLAFASQARRDTLAAEFHASLSPARRLNMWRDGTLTDATASYVRQNLGRVH